jgi:hypothetical protein
LKQVEELTKEEEDLNRTHAEAIRNKTDTLDDEHDPLRDILKARKEKL